MGCHCHDHDHEHECECEEHHHDHHHEPKRDPAFSRILLIGRCGLGLVLALLGHFLFSEANLISWGVHPIGALLINLAIMLVAYLTVAYDIIASMIHDVFVEKEFFGEETLMVLASVGAFSLRLFGPEANEFLEAVLVVLLFQVGEMLEDVASAQSKDSIMASIDVRHHRCQVETEDGLVYKVPEQLEVGDICVYGAGMKILCDGRVYSGEGSVDESSLTGEAMPVRKEKGDDVYSLTILKEGSIKVVVEKEYEDSTAAKMMELIEESSERKGRITRAIDAFSKVYTPIVMAIALLVAVLPPLFLGIGESAVWSKWIFTALSFLLVSCPCAIVISVPLAYFVGLGLASRKGILVKGAAFFDALSKPRLIAFDKTGTLTKGSFSIVDHKAIGISEEEFAAYLCACESRSTHPLASAITSGLEGKYDPKLISSYKEEPGLGVRLSYLGKTIKAGKAEFLKECEIPAEDLLFEGTRVYLSVDNAYAGYLTLADQIKENAAESIRDLKGLGLTTLLLSGDKKAEVEVVGQKLGIDRCYGELNPEEKTAFVAKEKESGTVIYCGDGINDAASLKLADIGIAMGARGSDLALECADCLLLGDDLGKVSTLIRIARKTRRRANFNIAFALIVKFAIVLTAFLGSLTGLFALPLWVAALGDTGITLLCILFSALIGIETNKR